MYILKMLPERIGNYIVSLIYRKQQTKFYQNISYIPHRLLLFENTPLLFRHHA